jgi:DNA-binding transcriptional LysR family regulator
MAGNRERRMIGRLRLRHLELVSAIYDSGAILRASQLISLSQPAVTKALQEIEQMLDVKLFTRSSRGLTPTEHGHIFAAHAKTVLAQIRHSAEELQDLSTGFAGHVSVGTLLTASAELLPKSIIALKQGHPGVAISIFDGTYDVLLPRLKMGDLDMVVGRVPDGLRSQGLDCEIFFTEQACLVTRPGHPLTKRRKLQLKDLVDLPWLLPVRESYLRRQIEVVFAAADLSLPRNIVESMSATANRVLIEGSDLIELLPYSVARLDLEAGRLVRLAVPLPGTSSPVGAILRREAALRPAATALLEQMRIVGARIAKAARL